MACPKKKTSNAKRDQRRAHWRKQAEREAQKALSLGKSVLLVVLTALSIPLKRKKKGKTRNNIPISLQLPEKFGCGSLLTPNKFPQGLGRCDNLMVGSEVEKTFSLPNILRFVENFRCESQIM